MPAPKISSQPVCLQDRATFAGTEHASNVNLDARLGEREVAFAKTHRVSLTVKLIGEIRNHALEVAEGDIFTHSQTLNLVEHRLGTRCHLLER